MSGKILKKVAIGAAVIGLAVATGGISIAPTLASAGVGGIGAFAVAGGLSTTFLGGLALSFGASQILGGVTGALAKTPKASAAQLSALTLSTNPTEPRKWGFGYGIMPADVRYIEPSGTDQEYVDYIIACAAHRVQAFEQIWFEDELVWTGTGGVPGKYSGYLWVTTRTEGRADNTIAINGGTKWGTSRRLTGCAYIHIRIRRTGVNKKAESPLAGGLPARISIIGKKGPVYDPRYDSTVGGSGPQRANDPSTWAFHHAGGNQGYNPALQILTYLLGYRINSKVSVGCGIPPARINMASFITAANLCEESVLKINGTYAYRYWSHGIASEADDRNSVLGALLAGCNGRLRDSGKLSLAIMHNDLGGAAADAGLNDDDVLSGFIWDPDPSLDQSFNIVRGRYTDPSPNSLYQMVDYPEVSLASVDGIDRVLPLDLPTVQDAAQAQRIAKQVLQRKQYDRSFSVKFGANAWRYDVGDIVPFTFAALAFDRRPFRIDQQTINMDGTCDLVLTEESAAIYAWDSTEAPAVQVAEPVRYDSRNNPLILGIDEASTTAIWSSIADDGGKPDDYADVTGVHTSLDTANVGGVPAATVLADIAMLDGITGPGGSIALSFAEIDAELDDARGELAQASSGLALAQAGLATALSSINTVVTQVKLRPNLQVNGGFDRGLEGLSDLATGAAIDVNNALWGNLFAYVKNGTHFTSMPPVNVFGGQTYVASYDRSLIATAGRVRMDVVFYDGPNGTGTLTDPGIGSANDPAVTYFTNDSRREFNIAVPAGTQSLRLRMVSEDVAGATFVGFRRIKLELGSTPASIWSNEASGNLIDGFVRLVEAARANDAAASAARFVTVEARVATTEGVATDAYAGYIANAQTIATTTAAQASFNGAVDAHIAAVEIVANSAAANYTTLATSLVTANAAQATVNGQVAARLRQGAPNLLANGAFHDDLSGWTVVGTGWEVVKGYPGGPFAQNSGGAYNAGIYRDRPAQAGVAYSLGAEMDPDTAGDILCFVQWINLAGELIDSALFIQGDGWSRVATGPVVAPVGTATVRTVVARVGTNGHIRITRIQVQEGPPTDFDDSASLVETAGAVKQTQLALVGTNASLASLQTTVTASVATAQGTANGAAGNATLALGQISNLASAVASADEAAASQIDTLTSNYNGLAATVTVQAAALATIGNKTQSYIKTTVTAGGASVALSLVAVDENGLQHAGGILDGDFYINGRLMVSRSIYVDGLDYGSQGQSSLWVNANTATVGSTTAWASFAQLQIEPDQGEQLRCVCHLAATCTAGVRARIKIRVRRDDGTILYSGPDGLGQMFEVSDWGSAISFGWTDTVNAGRSTTHFLDAIKADGNNNNVNLDATFSTLDEFGRMALQHATINTPSGTGPGAGSGGGGNVGGGGGGFECPEVSELILLANDARDGPGDIVPVGSVRCGWHVWTQHSETMQWGAHRITYVGITPSELWEAPGLPVTSSSHLWFIDGAWVRMAEIGTPLGRRGQVVSLHVAEARTYVLIAANGSRMLSHNKFYQYNIP